MGMVSEWVIISLTAFFRHQTSRSIQPINPCNSNIYIGFIILPYIVNTGSVIKRYFTFAFAWFELTISINVYT